MKIKKQIYILIFLFVVCASAGAEANTDMASPDQKAVDFTLPDQDGKMWTLSETLKDFKAVVLAFYPKDDTGV